jgi:hypothetical protein
MRNSLVRLASALLSAALAKSAPAPQTTITRDTPDGFNDDRNVTGVRPGRMDPRRAGVLPELTETTSSTPVGQSVKVEPESGHVLDSCYNQCGGVCGCNGCGKGCCGCATCTLCYCPAGQYDPSGYGINGQCSSCGANMYSAGGSSPCTTNCMPGYYGVSTVSYATYYGGGYRRRNLLDVSDASGGFNDDDQTTAAMATAYVTDSAMPVTREDPQVIDYSCNAWYAAPLRPLAVARMRVCC